MAGDSNVYDDVSDKEKSPLKKGRDELRYFRPTLVVSNTAVLPQWEYYLSEIVARRVTEVASGGGWGGVGPPVADVGHGGRPCLSRCPRRRKDVKVRKRCGKRGGPILSLITQ